MRKSLALVPMAILSTILASSGCGKAQTKKSDAEYDAAAASAENNISQMGAASHRPAKEAVHDSQTDPNAPPGSGQTTNIERKIIYTSSIELIVEDLDVTHEKLDALINQHKGYVSESEVRGQTGSQRSATWTIRIPVAELDAFRAAIVDLGVPERDGLSSQDVTDEFYDLKTRIANAQKEEKRLLELLERRTDDLKDVLAVEKELSRVREKIERMKGRIQLLQNLTSLTTVRLTINERKTKSPRRPPRSAPASAGRFPPRWKRSPHSAEAW